MGSEISIRPATSADASKLAAIMRPADVAEVVAGGETPIESLLNGLHRSRVALSAWHGDELGAMFGVIVRREGTLLGGVDKASIWSLTGPVFERFPIAFCKGARTVLRELLDRFPELTNMADARHRGALRFLAFLGAEFAEPMPFGPVGQLFVPFRFRRSQRGRH